MKTILLMVLLLCASHAFASMAIVATKTSITVSTTPNLGGSELSHSWTLFVGPIRARDRQYVTGIGNWGGARCQGTIISCKRVTWLQIESAWASYFGAVTLPRTDTDWQPGDQICEGTAYKASSDANWIPSPGEIKEVGSCVALPDPRPVTCDVTSAMTIAHGDMPVSAVNGKTSTTTATVTCTGSTTVNLRAILSTSNPTSRVPVRTDGSITSLLTINGVDGATGLTVPVNAGQPATVTLMSTLSSATPTPGPLQGSAVLVANAQQKPISITGNVVNVAAPKPALRMVAVAGAQSKLAVTWGWLTTSMDYGSAMVPANYSVGLFIRNASQGAWSGFEIDSAPSAAASWGDRIRRFHDARPNGAIEQQAPGTFPAGTWCVTLAAASTPETGGQFLAAPGAPESCVTIPRKRR